MTTEARHYARTTLRGLGLALSLMVPLVASRATVASCAYPDDVVAYSSIEDGAEVPEGGVLWLLTGGARAEVWVDGVQLTGSEARKDAPYPLAGLAPGPHELEVRVWHDAPDPSAWSAAFTIVADTSPVGRPLGTPSLREIEGGWPSGCWSVLNTQECYDTGQDTFVEVSVGVDREPTAWWVEAAYDGRFGSNGERRLLPAVCGAPRIFMRGGEVPGACFTVTPLYPEGPGATSEVVCGTDGGGGVGADAGHRDVGGPDASYDVGPGGAGGDDVVEVHAGGDDGGGACATSRAPVTSIWTLLGALLWSARRSRLRGCGVVPG